MATFRAENNKKAYEDQPSVILPKNERSGDLFVSYDEFAINTISEANDVVLCQLIPSEQKVYKIKVINAEGIADGVFTAGISSNLELGDREEVVAADADAFMTAQTLAATTLEHNIELDAAGYLKEYERPAFLTLTFTTAPTTLDTKKLKIVVETIGK